VKPAARAADDFQYRQVKTMGFFFVDPETYRKYKDEVIILSQSIQVNYQEHLPREERKPGLSDRQIAEKLGLPERVVREIRCVAEREYYPIDEWEAALRFKDETCRAVTQQGISAVTRKYREKRKAEEGKSG
jgi:ribosome-binding protein aMBF1 (putative translation factor)